MSEAVSRADANQGEISVREPAGIIWTSLGLVTPLGARVSGGVPKGGATGISIDTRTLQAGELFFAIHGANSDGHDYVARAFEKGALAAVVDEAHAGALTGLGPLYVVRDVLASLERLGVAARARVKARVVAVTGSVGKTSTKEALRLALTQGGAVHASVASYNNHWGVPLTLARMPKETRFGVFEIGMNHAGEITPLSEMARPHVAIITTVAPVHIENFASVEAIADAKAEIFDGLEPGGVAILHRDNPHYQRLYARAKASPAGHVASFGDHESAEARLIRVRLFPDYSIIEAQICGRRLHYRLGAPGRHLAMNSLAVLLAAKAFGVDLDAAAGALAFFTAQPGRGQRLTLAAVDGPYALIDESYNANPASMRAAFELAGALPLPSPGRRIAVLGDMLELGVKGAAMHAELADDLRANHIDLVFAAGPLMKSLYDALPVSMQGAWRESASLLEPEVAAAVRAGDIVVVKGSNGSRMSVIVGALKQGGADGDAAQNGRTS
ncbi:UDP-N-acetylmuramoyl-tripeptide--D-alanyl-D-alanine ligase [Methylocella tundrae]|uniref:UDP-N-acetylmuramoyl-tripeptide--D-alanyl-D-alanine ligase n=1 Tax=Methylocella tundrae TaxID=227605 RepID=A0A4U8YYV1_METTU|nr:UDP-N-acetylmuramoylalanyl-D-glutamyl-2,6-diaminopimelate--D-alanyl-D-alanine ligase [Methylocella tundrae]WPP06103.1 UDP-N-acetylmuramoylalanyl-D-glutamyl-2,6-diaminopimelate--D-alanyl-D-alanine ligase [Methylocella tundrae]VFU08710.1 UDP-N-acetylmuramoyl-tripeptide--D-alanyl-D-alanine ligase [Methylocella tundrae]